MPLAQLYDRFLAQVAKLQSDSLTNGLAYLGTVRRQWMTPDGVTDPQDVPGVAVAFDREAIAADYMGFFDHPYGSSGDCMAAKMQSDRLALQERAHRLRHLSQTRAAAHSASRLVGQGHAGYGVHVRTALYVQDIIMAGSTDFPSEGY